MTKEEKAALKAERAEIDAVYGWAFLNGRKEKVGNYRIEPPVLRIYTSFYLIVILSIY